MKHVFAASLLAFLCGAPAIAQESGEFVIITVQGSVGVRVLPWDRELRFNGDYLILSEHDRMPANRIAAVRPKRSEPLPGYHEVRLNFKTITGKSIIQSFWIPDRYTRIEQAPKEGAFFRIDRQTLLREGSYEVLSE